MRKCYKRQKVAKRSQSAFRVKHVGKMTFSWMNWVWARVCFPGTFCHFCFTSRSSRFRNFFSQPSEKNDNAITFGGRRRNKKVLHKTVPASQCLIAWEVKTNIKEIAIFLCLFQLDHDLVSKGTQCTRGFGDGNFPNCVSIKKSTWACLMKVASSGSLKF